MASLVFAGTPEFAARALRRLLAPDVAARHPLRAVLTQPDRPAGRGQRRLASPVKTLALAQGLPVWQPATLRDPAARDALIAGLHAVACDYLVVAAYGLILPPEVLAAPHRDCLNIHASLLPRWRGAAPIVRAIEHEDLQTGVCIMRMEAGLDTGPVCLRRAVTIGAGETAGELHDRLATLGAEAIVAALDGLEGASLAFEAQSTEGVTYARKIDKSEAVIDWRRPARAVAAGIRAFDPAPGATAMLTRAPDLPLRLFRAEALPAGGSDAPAGRHAAPPGRVLERSAEGLVIGCHDGAVRVRELQRPGARRLPVAAFLAGHPILVGDEFVTAVASDGS